VARARAKAANAAKVVRRSQAQSQGQEQSLFDTIILFSSVYMVLWVFGFPGSAWVGSSVEHDDWLRDLYNTYFAPIAPSSLLLKYGRYGSSLEWLHAVPGAFWCFLAPFQLLPAGRQLLGPKHGFAGRLMLLAASVLMVGFLLIDAAKLTADQADFGTGGHLASAADDVNARYLGFLPPFNQGGQYAVAAWFVFTGMQTFRTGITKNEDHPRWATRHAAAGLWVAGQRPLFSFVRTAQLLLLGSAAEASIAQADAFYGSSYVITLTYIALAEASIQKEHKTG